MTYNVFGGTLNPAQSNLSLVYLLVCHPPFYTPYVSSPDHYLLFTAHAHTITTEIMSSNPCLTLSSLLSFTLTSYVHLTILISATEVPSHFLFLQAMSHFHATYYFAHNCCTKSPSHYQ